MMKPALNHFILATVFALVSASVVSAAEPASPAIRIETGKGDIVVALNPDKAPVSVENFLSLVDEGAYDGTIFHRVIPGFMVQGGGYTPQLEERSSEKTIHNEADNGLTNRRGTIAMARRNEIDSASRQFFINVADNGHLDHSAESCTREEMQAYFDARQKGLFKPLTCKNFGYAVFGRVIEGMDLVDRIEAVETKSTGQFANLPVEPVVIERVVRIEPGP